jgi:Icc-related predicted phosphoesterase
MKFVYGSDFHGDIGKYQKIFDFALSQKIDTLHLGADLLPKGSHMIKNQEKFVKNFLPDFTQKCKDKGITVLCFWGNDDCYPFKKLFREYGNLLDENPVHIGNYTFKAYGYVPDYPFGLKTACKLDYKGWTCPDEYISTPVEVSGHQFLPIPNVQEYFERKGTLEEDLRHVLGGRGIIMAIHSPPCSHGLDMCYGNRAVGSKSVLEWIEDQKPLILLSGHIHESYRVTGQWKVKIGNTLVIQPGQNEDGGKAVVVTVEVGEDIIAQRFEI